MVILSFFADRVNVYQKCYFCGDNPYKLRLLQKAVNETINILTHELLPNNFTDFKGHYFHVAYLDYFPYMFCRKKTRQVVNNVELELCSSELGSEAVALRELSKKLNFRYRLVSSGDFFNQSYVEVFQKVVNKDVHFAVGGITKTVDRVKKATFTKSIRFENYVLLYRRSVSLFYKLFYFMYPFNIVLWILVFTTIIAITLCLYFFVKVAKQSDITLIKSFFVS